jgi:hypothetical protein
VNWHVKLLRQGGRSGRNARIAAQIDPTSAIPVWWRESSLCGNLGQKLQTVATRYRSIPPLALLIDTSTQNGLSSPG